MASKKRKASDEQGTSVSASVVAQAAADILVPKEVRLVTVLILSVVTQQPPTWHSRTLVQAGCSAVLLKPSLGNKA